MTKEKIIEIAREYIAEDWEPTLEYMYYRNMDIEGFARAIEIRTKEKCAKVCDTMPDFLPQDCARVIRRMS